MKQKEQLKHYPLITNAINEMVAIRIHEFKDTIRKFRMDCLQIQKEYEQSQVILKKERVKNANTRY